MLLFATKLVLAVLVGSRGRLPCCCARHSGSRLASRWEEGLGCVPRGCRSRGTASHAAEALEGKGLGRHRSAVRWRLERGHAGVLVLQGQPLLLGARLPGGAGRGQRLDKALNGAAAAGRRGGGRERGQAAARLLTCEAARDGAQGPRERAAVGVQRGGVDVGIGMDVSATALGDGVEGHAGVSEVGVVVVVVVVEGLRGGPLHRVRSEGAQRRAAGVVVGGRRRLGAIGQERLSARHEGLCEGGGDRGHGDPKRRLDRNEGGRRGHSKERSGQQHQKDSERDGGKTEEARADVCEVQVQGAKSEERAKSVQSMPLTKRATGAPKLFTLSLAYDALVGRRARQACSPTSPQRLAYTQHLHRIDLGCVRTAI